MVIRLKNEKMQTLKVQSSVAKNIRLGAKLICIYIHQRQKCKCIQIKNKWKKEEEKIHRKIPAHDGKHLHFAYEFHPAVITKHLNSITNYEKIKQSNFKIFGKQKHREESDKQAKNI